MSEVQHTTIGASARKEDAKVEQKAEARKEVIERFILSPFNKAYRMDALSVWILWASLSAAVFLYCTVKAVTLAVQ